MSATTVASSPSQIYIQSPRFSTEALTNISSTSLPRKRRRLDDEDDPSVPPWTTPEDYDRCMRKQFVPHLNSALDRLPHERVDTHNIGVKVTEFFTKDPDSVFWVEYKRGNGVLSADFERYLLKQMVDLTERLAKRPEYQHRPKETPVPIPRFPILHPSPQPPAPRPHSTQASAPRSSQPARAYTPRVSTTPIPIPRFPARTPVSASPLSGGAGVASDPIVIDDEDDHVPQPLRLATQKVRSHPVSAQTVNGIRPGAAPRTERSRQSSPNRTPPAPNPVSAATSVPVTITHATPNPPVGQSAAQQREGGPGPCNPVASWFGDRLPYVPQRHRALILKGNYGVIQACPDLPPSSVFHADFTDEEVNLLHQTVLSLPGRPSWRRKTEPRKDMGSFAHQLFKRDSELQRVLAQIGRINPLPKRRVEDIRNFLYDLDRQRKRISIIQKEAAVLTLSQDNEEHAKFVRASRVESLLFTREIYGFRGLGSMRQLVNFKTGFRHCREDELALRAEWTDCAGDIATIAWVSNDAFVCGTTEHSDAHNQQYNKPGNLVLGSCSLGVLRAYPEHRITRPIVSKGENSTEEMRASQSPWLYTSVVASDYDVAHGRVFTSGFDRTVKVWRVDSDSASMYMLGEWKHGGNVNFVTASKHESGMIATAADVAQDAVRVYRIHEGNISASSYRSYSCSRVTDADGNTVSTEKWAYFPATMQWGLAQDVRHLLLVGYSPRSRTGDDNDIPVDRLNSGELCLWNGLTGERWKITTAKTQNVFEVLWHPSQACFIAATSPLGLDVPPETRTQIRIFCPSDLSQFGEKSFSPVKVLDCRAVDINELTLMPNHDRYCYVTAGCTDGNTYVWDTARGDQPIHVLRHGESVEPLYGDREREDVGVKFTAWGTTLDRFYTGSSDGLVKVWNIRSIEKPLVRTLMEAPAPISCGMFSPDKTKLVVGDASGRVFMLSVDEEDTIKPTYRTVKLPDGTTRTVKELLSITLHDDPPPPPHDAEGAPLKSIIAVSEGQAYLQSGQLQRHPNPTIGVVQGPRYEETKLFRAEAHLDGDVTKPLLAEWEVKQKDAQAFSGRKAQGNCLKPLKIDESLAAMHSRNAAADLNVKDLELETRMALEAEGVELEPDYDLDYEDEWGSDDD